MRLGGLRIDVKAGRSCKEWYFSRKPKMESKCILLNADLKRSFSVLKERNILKLISIGKVPLGGNAWVRRI